MTNATSMYDLSLFQAEQLIRSVGSKRTVMLQGHMGCGKSSILKTLAKALPTHTACYFDCTTKDLGDITIPNVAVLDSGEGFVRYYTNEELGAHLPGPVIIMIDEYGKANPAVKNAMLRLMQERQIGAYTLHPDSIIFATTNLGAEGVGDILPAHARNRMVMTRVRKPSNMEWIEYGINAGIDPALLGWCKETPQLFHSFEDISDPEGNPYIFHPKAQGRTSFVTPRSLESASDILKERASMDSVTLTSALIGTVGARGAMDLAAFVTLADQLPSLASIKDSPEKAPVPKSASAVCMVVYRTLSTIEADWTDAWMTYMARLGKEAQGLFANGIRGRGYNMEKASAVMRNKAFAAWAVDNKYLFGADKVS